MKIKWDIGYEYVVQTVQHSAHGRDQEINAVSQHFNICIQKFLELSGRQEFNHKSTIPITE